jgi:hypothetical protein
MSDDEKKDKASDAEKPANKPPRWEDSHTAASLPGWWQPEADETKPAQAQPPKPESTTAHPTPPNPPSPAAPPPAPTPPSAAPTQPPGSADWQTSVTAKELPTWWRPGEVPSTPESHAAATVPPAPHAEAPMPPAPMAPAPTPSAPRPPVAPQTPPVQPTQSAPPQTQPPPMAHPASPPPQPSQPPPSRHEKTMVLGVMPTGAPPMAILIVKSGPDMGFKFRIKPIGVAAVGRDLENEVVLDDPAASRRHAEIEFKDGAYLLTDLGSINGTLVNAERVTSRRLADGDRIVVGQNEIVISIM